MKKVFFIDEQGSFRLAGAGVDRELYFPLTGNKDLKSVVTPYLNGDAKLDQHHFLTLPVSVMDLHNNRSGRNFWCRMSDGSFFSAVGNWSGQQADDRTAMNDCAGQEAGGMTDDDETVIEAGLLWQRVRRAFRRQAMETEVLSFIPYGTDLEVMQVTIKNTGRTDRTFRPVGAIPIYGRSADNLRDHRHVTGLLGRIYVTGAGVFVTPTMSFDERGHKRNEHTYYVIGAGGDGDRPVAFHPLLERFIGAGGSLDCPEAIVMDRPGVTAGSYFEGGEALGGMVFAERTLRAGEEAVYLLLMGVEVPTADNSATDGARLTDQLFDRYGSREKIGIEFRRTTEQWHAQNITTVTTGDPQFDRYMKWIGFQPTLRRIFGCSFMPHHDYGKGGRGWRDLWQDLLALMIDRPEPVGAMLLNNFRGVRMDGTNATIIGTAPGEFVADRNNISRVWMDHGMWPFLTTNLYIHQSGDLGILGQEVDYFKDRQIMRGTAFDGAGEAADTVQHTADGAIYRGTILEHILIQNLTAFYEAGAHGHMRLRGADWNDALDMAEEKGESVAFTAAYAGNLEELSQLLRYFAENKGLTTVPLLEEILPLIQHDPIACEDPHARQDILRQYCQRVAHTVSGHRHEIAVTALVEALSAKAVWLKEHIRRTEWLAEGWFNSYYDNQGQQVEGSFASAAGGPDQTIKVRMMLTGQVFTIMSGTARNEQVEAIIESADKHLYHRERGGYCLNTDFRDPDELPRTVHEMGRHLGRMFGFAYGHKENGAVFSHMTTMYANALYQRGYATAGYKALHTLYRQAANIEQSRIYPGIPEYFDLEGRGLYHYLTGAASWYFLTVVTQMFGVRGHYGDLLLQPKLLPGQFNEAGEAAILVRFAGKKLRVSYHLADAKGASSPSDHYQIKNCQLDQVTVGQVIPRQMIQALDDDSEHLLRVQL